MTTSLPLKIKYVVNYENLLAKQEEGESIFNVLRGTSRLRYPTFAIANLIHQFF